MDTEPGHYRYGAERIDARTVRFCLWAPDASSVDVVLNGQASAMVRETDGHFIAELEASAGSRYRYRIDGRQLVPDPASRAQACDADGDSVVVDPQSYRWLCEGWQGRPWHEAIICEVHVGLLGGFAGLRARLPALVDSGYTTIELMPVAEFPGARNWGYDGVLPYAPEASYGSPDELKQLIDDAHVLGLMVLLDVVYNHFGPDANYLSTYATGFFRRGVNTPWGGAIDFDRPEVRRFFLDNALMWLNEYRFDGLRLDAVHAITPQAFLGELAETIRARCRQDRHVHLILENENNAARWLRNGFDAQWNDDGHNALHVLLTGEREGYYGNFADEPTAQLARVLAQGFAFQGEKDIHGKPRGEPSADLSPSSFVLFIQNHDQIGNRPMGDRLLQTVEPAAVKAALALVALCPMIPLFFMGEEWGCRDPFLFFTSHRDELAQKVRDGRRAEFAHFAGYADPALRASIPDPNAPQTFERSRPRSADDGETGRWTAWFSELLALRTDRLVPFLAGSKSLGCEVLGVGAVRARWRLNNGDTLEIALNLGPHDVQAQPRPENSLLYALPPPDPSTEAAGRLAPNSLRAHLAPEVSA